MALLRFSCAKTCQTYDDFVKKNDNVAFLQKHCSYRAYDVFAQSDKNVYVSEKARSAHPTMPMKIARKREKTAFVRKQMATTFLCRKSTPHAVPMRILLRAKNVVWLRDNLTSPRSDRAYEEFAKSNKNVLFLQQHESCPAYRNCLRKT